MAKLPYYPEFPIFDDHLQQLLEIQERIKPVAETMDMMPPALQNLSQMGASLDIGAQAIRQLEQNQQAIASLGVIQSAIGPLLQPDALSHILDQGSIVDQFGSTLDAIIANEKLIEGIQSSLPAIEAFNRQVAAFEQQGIDYSQIIKNLHQSDFLERYDAQLISPVLDIYNSCENVWAFTPDLSRISAVLDPLQDVIANYGGNFLSSQLSPLLETIFSFPIADNFWGEYLNKCAQALMDAKWSPSLLMSLSLDEIELLNEILLKELLHEKQISAIDNFVFTNFGKEYITSLADRWKMSPLPAHVKRLLKEALQAYNRKAYALVVYSLSMQWEGIIKEKAALPDHIKKSKAIKNALKKLVSENDYPEIIHTFFNDFIMHTCNGPEEAIQDIPGRHEFAHGWFVSYPSKKAALNAILFTDFLIDLEKIAEN